MEGAGWGWAPYPHPATLLRRDPSPSPAFKSSSNTTFSQETSLILAAENRLSLLRVPTTTLSSLCYVNAVININECVIVMLTLICIATTCEADSTE